MMRMHRLGVGAVALSLVVAACGNTSPTPGPSGNGPSPAASTGAVDASTAPQPTPAPTPVDVARLTAQKLSEDTLTANVAVAGTGTLGKVKSSIKGTLDIDGLSSHLVRTATTGKAKVTTDTMTANGIRYAKQKGVWVELGASTRAELNEVLRGPVAMQDLGVEAKDGQALHHLQATLPSVPAELELGKDATNATATMDAWVTNDGTPVLVTVTATWTQEVGGKTVQGTRTTDFTFTNVGGDVTVTAPERIWAFHKSKAYRFRIACPVDWTWEAGTTKYADSCSEPIRAVYASRARQTNTTLSYLTGRIVKQLQALGYKRVKVDSNRKSKLDGVPARKIEFHGTAGGEKVWGQAVYAIKGAHWYVVVWESFEKTDAEDRALFKQFVGSFDFR